MTLAPRWILNGLDLTDSPFLVERNGSDHGAPESVRSVLASMLADGDIDLIDRHGNRTFVLPVLIEGDGLDSLALAEAALVAAAQPERGTLVFEPGDGYAAACVFETFAAEVALEQDEDADSAGLRRARVTIPCRPFARASVETTIDAPATLGSTTTTVDDGSSTTGWSQLGLSAPSPQKNLIDPDAWTTGANCTSLSGNSSPAGAVQLVWASVAAGNSHVNSGLMNVTAGVTYWIGVDFNVGSAGSTPIGILYRWYQADGVTQIGGDVSATSSMTGGAFVSKQWAITAPVGAARLRIFPYSSTGGGGQNTAITKAFVVTDADRPIGFWDGATADTAAITYDWDGTAAQSTSTATWTAPSLAVVSGAVKGIVYGRTSSALRRTGAISMGSTPYLRVKGTATASASGQVTVADNGNPVTPTTYSYNPATGAFEIVVLRPTGFTTVDVTYSSTNAATEPSRDAGAFVAVDAVEKTDNPFGTGKLQSRQVTIYGSQRTELSLAVLGLDGAGTTPVGLGEQVLVHTSAKGTDGRSKFLACRPAAGLGGTTDATAVSGVYNTLGAVGSPTSFTFAAGTLLPGNYLAVGRVRMTATGSSDLNVRAFVDPSTGDNVYDPPAGWRTAPITCVASGAVWPQVNDDAWVMLPLGMLRLPPADIEDPAANLTIQVARGAAAVDLDDVFLLNSDIGKASLLLTGLASGSYSAVRLDAATVDHPQASAWVGVANGSMVADLARWVGEQHAAEPGLLQIATVTPGCATSRVSASYFRRYHTHVAEGV